MKLQFLTTGYFLRGKVFSLLEKLMPGNIESPTRTFGKGRWIKKQNKENLTSVGIFKKIGRASCRERV